MTSMSRSVALQAQPVAFGAQQHVGQDRDRVAPLHHAVDVAERLSSAARSRVCTFIRQIPFRCDGAGAAISAGSRRRRTARLPRWRRGELARSPAPIRKQPDVQLTRQHALQELDLFGERVVACASRPSILRTACSTVVWSRPPKRRPISGSERSVSTFDRYMAIWRGRTTAAGAARRQDVGAARRCSAWRRALDVLDLDALGLAVADEVADRRLGRLERHGARRSAWRGRAGG